MFITVAFKLAIGGFLIATDKGFCFEKRISDTILLEQCKRQCINLKMEQCERAEFSFSSSKMARNENRAVNKSFVWSTSHIMHPSNFSRLK